MGNFDFDNVMDMADAYLYFEGRDPKIARLVERLSGMLYHWGEWVYRRGEMQHTCKYVCEILADPEPTLEAERERVKNLKKNLRGVPMTEAVYIAAHVGFLYGVLSDENERLSFYKFQNRKQ